MDLSKFEYKIVRDPIHGFVGLSEKEIEIIDTPVFQRLRRIKQLANSYLVYPGAVHTRFEHSLGTLEMAFRVAKRLKSICDDTDKLRAIRYSALLHDIGHGPFSHVFEDIVVRITGNSDFKHEFITLDIIQNDENIRKSLGSDLENVLKVFDKSDVSSVEHGIIDSPLDADKLDYLQRDSYHAGVAYGIFDSTRVLYTLKEIMSSFLDKKESYLGVEMKGREAVMGMVLARYYMYETIYSHKTRRIADSMLIRSLELAAKNDEKFDKDTFRYSPSDSDFLKRFKELDDRKLLEMVFKSQDEKARRIAESLKNRKLFKALYGKDLSSIQARVRYNLVDLSLDEAVKMEQQIGEHIGIDPEFVIVDRQSISNPLYREPYEMPSGADVIYFQDGDEEPKELSDLPSPLSRTGRRTVERFWIYAPVKKEERLEKEKKVEEYVNSL